ncbi:unnamed protein product [Rotaria magnacalcarata]|uniref:V-SNARE coiled-coil homology domain-containing protein n=1 Tax=Rotaria magnacalcarata TaxID=392030 RepID=A0A816QQU2_9BILA|nr:unnamed protein product [Rotaria magnacalcarata]CAF1604005.1 unnamed protein product [Rotaria magnacalcarata]CAF1982583.1 unnamed protein product [Rotaria magnacalcarata]CAF2015084.1 unnamed protein product [Rotaria magnacalcarata]CAF2064043.1 unnamed protein product [Rotaria magnacalcarata]
MASAGYTRPQNYSNIGDDDEAALDIQIDSNTQSTGRNTVKGLHGQVQEVVGVMKQNIDKLLDRDVALNNLASRADDLHSSATTYNQTAKQLKRKYWWKNAKTNICIAGIIITVIIIIILSIVLSRGKK